jgi:tRNA (guanosine-2'-O-)-methyltransferase
MRTGRWQRWHGYMDELEEALRQAADELAAAEQACAADFERDGWPATQRALRQRELVRRALDMPFLRELLLAARALDELPKVPVAPGEVRAWGPHQQEVRRPAADAGPVPPTRTGGRPAMKPPARLRVAERALRQRTRALTVVLEELVNPRNASAVVRTAEALGLQEVHLVDPAGRPRLLDSITQRSQRWLDLTWHRHAAEAIAGLRARGFTIAAADFGPGARPLDELPLAGPTALVLGSEQRGVSPALREQADHLFYLGTVGFGSYLNVSVAAGIALFLTDQRMRELGLRSRLDPDDRARLRERWYRALAPPHTSDEEVARWAADPPEPAPLVKPVPSREKAREPRDA